MKKQITKNPKVLLNASDMNEALPEESQIVFTNLNQEIPEELRNPVLNNLERRKDTVNWSQDEDRGEDLAETRDAFMQQPERDTQIPPELTQPAPYQLYEQRIALGKFPNNLADLFDEERELQGESFKRQI